MAAILIATSMMMTSCYSTTAIVGQGAQGNEKVTSWNNYLLMGLIPVGRSDSKEMAGEATDYSVKTRQTFVNGLLMSITFGIYTPTTTTVTK